VESQSALRAGNQRWPGLCHNPQDARVFLRLFWRKKALLSLFRNRIRKNVAIDYLVFDSSLKGL
jgi:hypothetical protein